MAARAVQKVLIVGGVAGGASCAARLRRLSEAVSITIFEKGPYVSFANCGLPYHVGNIIPVSCMWGVQWEAPLPGMHVPHPRPPLPLPLSAHTPQDEGSLLVANAQKFDRWFNVAVQENTEV